MAENNIPHPDYYSCNTREELEILKDILELPLVLKADGLAAGKGVIITNSLQEAKSSLFEMINESKFGKAGTIQAWNWAELGKVGTILTIQARNWAKFGQSCHQLRVESGQIVQTWHYPGVELGQIGSS